MKPRITKEQAEAIEYLKKQLKWRFKTLIETHIEGFKSIQNLSLNDLTLEELAHAWINGYEIKIPPSPKLKTKNIVIDYTNDFEYLEITKEPIYIAINNPLTKMRASEGFSIDEAKEICNVINDLIYHYNQYVKQGDKQ